MAESSTIIADSINGFIKKMMLNKSRDSKAETSNKLIIIHERTHKHVKINFV